MKTIEEKLAESEKERMELLTKISNTKLKADVIELAKQIAFLKRYEQQLKNKLK